MPYALAIHGGAGARPGTDYARQRAHMADLLEAGQRMLEAGRDAVATVTAMVAEQEASDDPATWILRLPTQPPTRVRTLGSRTLHEVPAAELAEYMLEFRVQNELISREDLFRKVLHEYGLTRLTEATTNRLDYVLDTWF